jgi:hypothetical protein
MEVVNRPAAIVMEVGSAGWIATGAKGRGIAGNAAAAQPLPWIAESAKERADTPIVEIHVRSAKAKEHSRFRAECVPRVHKLKDSARTAGDREISYSPVGLVTAADYGIVINVEQGGSLDAKLAREVWLVHVNAEELTTSGFYQLPKGGRERWLVVEKATKRLAKLLQRLLRWLAKTTKQIPPIL